MNYKMINEKDTIAAICTGLTGSGINIIRISGDESFNIAEKIFRSVSDKKISDMGRFSVNYGFIVDNKDSATEKPWTRFSCLKCRLRTATQKKT